MTCGVALSQEHRHLVDGAMAVLMARSGAKTLSDPWFANLYLFRKVHDHRFHGGRLPFVSGRTYDGVRYVLPLFDVTQASSADLLALLADGSCLFPLSQEQVADLDPERFEWDCLRADSDYLYEAGRFRDYAGRDLAPKRNLVRQLLASQAVEARPCVPALEPAALEVLERWMSEKRKARTEADVEACSEALHCMASLGLVGRMYFAGAEPAGFLIAQLLPHAAVIRFAKASDRFKGIYQYMFQEFCLALPDLEWVNFEQDLGLANFRQTKMSYRPHALISKYRVRLRSRETAAG